MDVQVPAVQVVDASATYGIPYSKMRPWIRLGTDERIYAKKPVLTPSIGS